jgi:hypothetical protein
VVDVVALPLCHRRRAQLFDGEQRRGTALVKRHVLRLVCAHEPHHVHLPVRELRRRAWEAAAVAERALAVACLAAACVPPTVSSERLRA